jgi:hypothetical protein
MGHQLVPHIHDVPDAEPFKDFHRIVPKALSLYRIGHQSSHTLGHGIDVLGWNQETVHSVMDNIPWAVRTIRTNHAKLEGHGFYQRIRESLKARGQHKQISLSENLTRLWHLSR